MSNRNKNRLDRLKQSLSSPAVDEVVPEANAAASRSSSTNLLKRENTLNRLASGKQRSTMTLLHDPERVAIWLQHNRNYDQLNSARCSDLIEGFKRTGKQEFPVIVRPLKGNPNHDYELICGARRRWTSIHLGWDLLIEVRELTDRQAFILQDLENRDREDISDHERAVDYKNALPIYFENNVAEMARFLEIDRGNFSRLLDLADLPPAIIEAYGDLRELKAHHGTAYKRLLADPKTKRLVMDRARALKGEGADGKTVLAALTKAATPPKKPVKKTPRSTRYDILTATPKANGKVELVIDAPSGDAAGHIQALRSAFEAYLDSIKE